MNNFPSLTKMQWNLWLFGWIKIPMIAFCRPRIVQWDENRIVIRIKRSRRTNNHLKSMYVGVMMVGADLAAGMHAFAFSVSQKKKISLAFKSCDAQFYKRTESHVFFESNAGEIVQEMIQNSLSTGERMNRIILVSVKDIHHELLAEIKMEISLKVLQ